MDIWWQYEYGKGWFDLVGRKLAVEVEGENERKERGEKVVVLQF